MSGYSCTTCLQSDTEQSFIFGTYSVAPFPCDLLQYGHRCGPQRCQCSSWYFGKIIRSKDAAGFSKEATPSSNREAVEGHRFMTCMVLSLVCVGMQRAPYVQSPTGIVSEQFHPLTCHICIVAVSCGKAEVPLVKFQYLARAPQKDAANLNGNLVAYVIWSPTFQKNRAA